ncbi:hypothetical protein NLG97_g6159 [Lecanicillium saksenae]|uniref:Uncharacterized protein n=1 Tax=Lecanicillium saksenae TaxID=468837 RepID=A0ACC1QST5_9HYPO|nr:hypothetical protein NLG97_g6159 [Lecanicillium saksenae]
MAANMQHMAGAGHMLSQQQQLQLQQHTRSNANQYGQTIMARLQATAVPTTGWHATMTMNDRVGRALELYVIASAEIQHLLLRPQLAGNLRPLFPTNPLSSFTNVTLGSPVDPARALDMSINFEIQAFTNCGSKEHYYTIIKNKIVEFFKRRQANSSNLQNGLNASAQAQAQQQTQNMLNMQQMGRGFNPQQGFAGMNQGMQGQQMPNQQQMLQLQQQQQQQQQQMAASMGMMNQAGRGMAGPGQQMAMGQANPNQGRVGIMTELSRLPPR